MTSSSVPLARSRAVVPSAPARAVPPRRGRSARRSGWAPGTASVRAALAAPRAAPSSATRRGSLRPTGQPRSWPAVSAALAQPVSAASQRPRSRTPEGVLGPGLEARREIERDGLGAAGGTAVPPPAGLGLAGEVDRAPGRPAVGPDRSAARGAGGGRGRRGLEPGHEFLPRADRHLGGTGARRSLQRAPARVVRRQGHPNRHRTLHAEPLQLLASDNTSAMEWAHCVPGVPAQTLGCLQPTRPVLTARSACATVRARRAAERSCCGLSARVPEVNAGGKWRCA